MKPQNDISLHETSGSPLAENRPDVMPGSASDQEHTDAAQHPIYDVLIVGAGASGLFLALTLLRRGLSVLVLEQLHESARSSRSIGIHPPSMALFAQLGLAEALRSRAVSITHGRAFVGRHEVGRLPLASGAGAEVVLSIPQWQTEEVLEKALPEGVVRRGHRVTGITQESDGVRVECVSATDAAFEAETMAEVGPAGAAEASGGRPAVSAAAASGGRPAAGAAEASGGSPAVGAAGATSADASIRKTFRARLVIGADGVNSTVRTLSGIDRDGGVYIQRPGILHPRLGLSDDPADTRALRFCMGDFPDTTDFGSEPVVYITESGLTESFPLPGGLRRWVINDDRGGRFDLAYLIRAIEERTGHRLEASKAVGFSAFKVYRHAARRLVDRRVVLLGDAAHVMSPIGGQGMNLGWLNAWYLSEELAAVFSAEADLSAALSRYESRALALARLYSDRAAFNTKMGIPGCPEWLMRIVVRLLLSAPVAPLITRRFTMR